MPVQGPATPRHLQVPTGSGRVAAPGADVVRVARAAWPAGTRLAERPDPALRKSLGRLSVVALVAGAASLCAPGAHAHTSGEAGPHHTLEHVFALTLAPAWEITYTATRWITYSAVLLAAGGALFFIAIHDRRPSERRLLAAVVTGAAVTGVAGTIAGIPLQAAEISGVGAAARMSLLAVLETAAGTSSLARLAGLALLLAAVPAALNGRGRAALLLGAGAAVLSFALAGHTVTAEPRWIAVIADACHTLAASIWFGGLILLGTVLRRRNGVRDPVEGAAMVARFSAWATGALAAVAVAGLTLAWVEVRTLAAFTSTSYGLTLAAKVAIVAAVAAVGAYNNRLLVPAITRAGHSSPTEGHARAWRQLSWTVRAEAVGLLAALAVTAALVQTAPPRPFADQPAEHSGIFRPEDIASARGRSP